MDILGSYKVQRRGNMKKANVNIPDDVLEKTDKRAKLLGISRSAFITMTLSEKLMQTDVFEGFPELLSSMKELMGKEGK